MTVSCCGVSSPAVCSAVCSAAATSAGAGSTASTTTAAGVALSRTRSSSCDRSSGFAFGPRGARGRTAWSSARSSRIRSRVLARRFCRVMSRSKEKISAQSVSPLQLGISLDRMAGITLVARETRQAADSFRAFSTLPDERFKRPERVAREMPMRGHGADKSAARDLARSAIEIRGNRQTENRTSARD